MDNVTPIRPAPPATPPPEKKKWKLRHHRLVAVALNQHQSRIREATGILKLFDLATRDMPCSSITWEQWNALTVAVDGARRLLEQVNDLTEAEDLARVGNELLIKG